jgi:hypothetical protein
MAQACAPDGELRVESSRRHLNPTTQCVRDSNVSNDLAKSTETTFRICSLHVGNSCLPNEEAQHDSHGEPSQVINVMSRRGPLTLTFDLKGTVRLSPFLRH